MSQFSIVIPTKNEELYLPELLNSIMLQKKFNVYEVPIFIADNNSTDKTLLVAKYFKNKGLNINVIKGGRPAQARNNGANLCETEYILFIDSDVILTEYVLFTYSKYIQKYKKPIYTSFLRPIKNTFGGWLYYGGFTPILIFKDVIFRITGNILGGWNILIKKTEFDRVRGFDEKIDTHEDIKLGRQFPVKDFGVIPVFVNLSTRRFDKEGFWNVFWMYLRVFVRSKFSEDYSDKEGEKYFKS
jgi:glycosyltransferase involved in cell wall biosynthesis